MIILVINDIPHPSEALKGYSNELQSLYSEALWCDYIIQMDFTRLLLYFKSTNIIIMNQLFTFNSEQFTTSLKPALAKKILPIEDSYLRRK